MIRRWTSSGRRLCPASVFAAIALVCVLLVGQHLSAADTAGADPAGADAGSGALDRVLPELEFRDEPLSNAVLAVGDLAGRSVVVDGTLSGRVSQVLSPMSVRAALDTLCAGHGAFWWVEGEVIRVSRVRVSWDAAAGRGSVAAVAAPVAAVARRVAEVSTPPLLFDPLPRDPVTFRAEMIPPAALARLLVKRYPRYAVETGEEAIYIRDTARRDAGERPRMLEVREDEGGLTARVHGVSLGAALSRLFALAGREYVMLAAADRELRDIRLSGHGFDELLTRMLAAVDASYETDAGTYYIYDIDRRETLSRLERSVRLELSHIGPAELEELLPSHIARSGTVQLDRERGRAVVSGGRAEVAAVLRFISAVDTPLEGHRYRRFDLEHADVDAALASLPERFGAVEAVRVPGANALLARVDAERGDALERFLTLLDRRPESRVVRLRYIRADDLIRHLPPAVEPDHIHTTPDPRVVVVSGPADVQAAVRRALEVIDEPVPQLRYQLLVIQYQEGRSVEWTPLAESARMRPGDSTVFLGRIGELLSLDFDIVTSLGYRFAVELSHRIAENEARVLADTTLNGLSGRRVEFRNTDTFRYRDQQIDPETGEPDNLGVTREITSGLFVGIEGWASGDGMVTMTVSATLSRRGTDVSSDGTNPPPTSERVVDTQVRAPSGRPVVIGGLIQQDVSENVRKTPLLGSIPLLGRLFRSTTRSVEETELVLYVLPVIDDTPSERAAPTAERLAAYLDRLLGEAE
jgi:type II secretory pathway component GspD/PulD (secretin)